MNATWGQVFVGCYINGSDGKVWKLSNETENGWMTFHDKDGVVLQWQRPTGTLPVDIAWMPGVLPVEQAVSNIQAGFPGSEIVEVQTAHERILAHFSRDPALALAHLWIDHNFYARESKTLEELDQAHDAVHANPVGGERPHRHLAEGGTWPGR